MPIEKMLVVNRVLLAQCTTATHTYSNVNKLSPTKPLSISNKPASSVHDNNKLIISRSTDHLAASKSALFPRMSSVSETMASTAMEKEQHQQQESQSALHSDCNEDPRILHQRNNERRVSWQDIIDLPEDQENSEYAMKSCMSSSSKSLSFETKRQPLIHGILKESCISKDSPATISPPSARKAITSTGIRGRKRCSLNDLKDEIAKQESKIRKTCAMELNYLNAAKKTREKRSRMVRRLEQMNSKVRSYEANREGRDQGETELSATTSGFVLPPTYRSVSTASKKHRTSESVIDMTNDED